MVANITSQEKTLYESLRPVVESMGVDLVDVDVREHQGDVVIKIVIDSDEGIGIEDCGEISEQVAPVIEVEEPELFQGSQLEVTSPGVERRLRRTKEFDRYSGRRVSVKCYATYREQKNWSGTIERHDDEVLAIRTDEDNLIEIPLNKIASVRLEFDAEDYLSSGGNNNDG
jgi:ribosome maturation factor RimP